MNVESHPFEPFLPPDARLLMLGTFPPARKRWAMPFYYPNFTNDMWRIFGLCYFHDKDRFVITAEKTYDQAAIVSFLREQGIAMYDTCTRIVRTTGTASDKDLLIVEETRLADLLGRLPRCRAVITAGQLATTVACRQLGLAEPRVGEYSGSTLRLYRMPSSSRAYPMKLEQKAAYYQRVFDYIHS